MAVFSVACESYVVLSLAWVNLAETKDRSTSSPFQYWQEQSNIQTSFFFFQEKS